MKKNVAKLTAAFASVLLVVVVLSALLVGAAGGIHFFAQTEESHLSVECEEGRSYNIVFEAVGKFSGNIRCEPHATNVDQEVQGEYSDQNLAYTETQDSTFSDLILTSHNEHKDETYESHTDHDEQSEHEKYHGEGSDHGEDDHDHGDDGNHDDHDDHEGHDHIDNEAPIPSDLPVPFCGGHNNTNYHSLVKRDSSGNVTCTYGHEHADDPNELNNIFGSVGTYTGGQEISYPWETHGAAGSENDQKHNVYKWSTASVSDCKRTNATYGFKNIRAQYHSDAIFGSQVRFHSYWLEAQTCDPDDDSYAGIIRMGGHMDYGKLHITGLGHVPLAGDPTEGDDRRLHMGAKNGDVECCRNGDATWYGSNRFNNVAGLDKVTVRNGIREEDWGALNIGNTREVIYSPHMWYGGQFNGNGSWQEPVPLLGIVVPEELT